MTAVARVCPTCKRPLPVDADKAPHRPFCSPRCKMADLGGWLTGAYRISRPLDEEDLDEGIPRGAVGDADAGRLDGPRRDEDAEEPSPPTNRGKRGSSGTRRSTKVH